MSPNLIVILICLPIGLFFLVKAEGWARGLIRFFYILLGGCAALLVRQWDEMWGHVALLALLIGYYFLNRTKPKP